MANGSYVSLPEGTCNFRVMYTKKPLVCPTWMWIHDSTNQQTKRASIKQQMRRSTSKYGAFTSGDNKYFCVFL